MESGIGPLNGGIGRLSDQENVDKHQTVRYNNEDCETIRKWR